jgi:hypothetical protein
MKHSQRLATPSLVDIQREKMIEPIVLRSDLGEHSSNPVARFIYDLRHVFSHIVELLKSQTFDVIVGTRQTIRFE